MRSAMIFLVFRGWLSLVNCHHCIQWKTSFHRNTHVFLQVARVSCVLHEHNETVKTCVSQYITMAGSALKRLMAEYKRMFEQQTYNVNLYNVYRCDIVFNLQLGVGRPPGGVKPDRTYARSNQIPVLKFSFGYVVVVLVAKYGCFNFFLFQRHAQLEGLQKLWKTNTQTN